MTPTASPIPAPTIEWIGSEAEPSDEFLDAMVALLANVVDKQLAGQAAAGDGQQEVAR